VSANAALNSEPPVGEDALQRPTRPSVERPQAVAQEERGRRSRQLWQQPGHPVRARGVASGDLPHFADALELADVERVEAHELARLRGLDVATSGAARLGQAPAGPVGEQPARPGAVVLEQREAIASARQPGPAQDALDRCWAPRGAPPRARGERPCDHSPRSATPAPRPGPSARCAG
jgi:hypothetical protein